MTALLRAAVFAFALSISAACAVAQSAPAAPLQLTIGDRGVALSLEQLSKLPQIDQEVTFKTSKGVSTARYKGPLLWEVLKAAKALDGLGHNKELAKTLLVTASDDYQIAFSVGELSPDFGNAVILLALETDGKPMPDGYRIVAQGDKRGARAVHDIVKIEVK